MGLKIEQRKRKTTKKTALHQFEKQFLRQSSGQHIDKSQLLGF